MKRSHRWTLAASAVASSCSLFAGCATRQSVIATTGTVIGIEISQNPTNQMYSAKMGYDRAELAIVPTNLVADENRKKTTTTEPGKTTTTTDEPLLTESHGAEDVAPVLMELHYHGWFDSGSNGGIYQRLAVGKEAVQSPGAAMMFLRDGEAQKIGASKLDQLGPPTEKFYPTFGDLQKAKESIQAALKNVGGSEADKKKETDRLNAILAKFDAAAQKYLKIPNATFEQLLSAYSSTDANRQAADAAVRELAADADIKPYLPKKN